MLYPTILFKVKWVFTLTSTAVILFEHLPRARIQSPDLSALSPKVLFIRPPRLLILSLLTYTVFWYFYYLLKLDQIRNTEYSIAVIIPKLLLHIWIGYDITNIKFIDSHQ